jgi:hypothetical protein
VHSSKLLGQSGEMIMPQNGRSPFRAPYILIADRGVCIWGIEPYQLVTVSTHLHDVI